MSRQRPSFKFKDESQRLFEFLEKNPGQWTDAALAEKFSKSERQIRNYLQALKPRGLCVKIKRRRFDSGRWWTLRALSIEVPEAKPTELEFEIEIEDLNPELQRFPNGN